MLPLLNDTLPETWLLPEGPTYRRDQLCQWVFKKKASSFDEMLNLSQPLRQHLSEHYSLQGLEMARVQGSRDTTLKYLWKLRKGDFVESVLIPATPDTEGNRAPRHTLCVSSQVGCAYGCRFCASGLDGWKRNLSSGEIVGQIIKAERQSGIKINNLVFMGMGEPMANYANLMQAITMINAPWGLGIGARHITLSTSGLVPQILKLAEQPLQLQLAISLHGASDEVRSQIMPVNKKYPIDALLGACEQYVSRKQRMVTLEYILIENVNDMPKEAMLLASHAKRLGAKVNLIPYNKVDGLDWSRPSEEVIQTFAQILIKKGVTATVRREKGHDIDAACGQLRLRELKNLEG